MTAKNVALSGVVSLDPDAVISVNRVYASAAGLVAFIDFT